MIVMGVGLGGTITGVAKIKEKSPKNKNYWCRPLWFNTWRWR